MYICRAEGRVLALAFDGIVPNDDKELHVALEPETLRKLGDVFVRQTRTVLGTGSAAGSTASAGSLGFGVGNPFGAFLGSPAPLFSGGLSTSQAQSGALGTSGLFG